jgi:guanyl-specific ribonuclease Sa
MHKTKLHIALLIALIFAGGAYAQAPETPETVVRNFYKWYLTEMGAGRNPRDNKRIVMKAASRRTSRWYYSPAYSEWGADYFINAQDFDEHWAKNLTVSNAVIRGNTATTKVTLSVPKTEYGPAYKRTLSVRLVRESGVWKIDVVDNMIPGS